MPSAPFAGPDTAWNSKWVAEFARQRPFDACLLTHHFYPTGPGSSPEVTIDRLLNSTRRLNGLLLSLKTIARDARLPYRLAETNSCFLGGRPGVSDAYASALWGVNSLFQAAEAGCAGVNFHGGRRGAYTPLAFSKTDGDSARPLYYAMLLFAQVGAANSFRR